MSGFRWAGVAVALFAVGMLSLLITQIVLLEDQRETVRSQRAILKNQSQRHAANLGRRTGGTAPVAAPAPAPLP